MVNISIFIYFDDSESETVLAINRNKIYINGEYVGDIYVSTTGVVVLDFKEYNKRFWKKFYSLHHKAIGIALLMGATVLYGYSPQFMNRDDAVTWLKMVWGDIVKTYYEIV